MILRLYQLICKIRGYHKAHQQAWQLMSDATGGTYNAVPYTYTYYSLCRCGAMTYHTEPYLLVECNRNQPRANLKTWSVIP